MAVDHKILKRYKFSALAIFLTIIGLSIVWNIHNLSTHTIEMVKKEADAFFNKDKAYRLWAASKGGIYVPVSESTPPNPFLAHIRERDITTASGKALTLMNPAYMLRQTMNEFDKLYGIKGHITSLKYLRPETAPDAWERKQLLKFESGVKKVSEVSQIEGKRFLRFMKPLQVQPSCLKCHADQGYKVGDIRGGVSLSIPLAEYDAGQRHTIVNILISHGLLILATLLVWYLVTRQFEKSLRKQHQTEEEKEALASRMDNILNAAGEGILGLDEAGRHTFVNPAAAAMLGYRVEEMIGQPSHRMWHHTRKDGTHFDDKSCPILDTITNGHIFVSNEDVFWKKDGTSIPVEYISTPIKHDEKVAGAVIIFRDVSEYVKTNNKLLENKAHIETLIEKEHYLNKILTTTKEINEAMITSQSEAELLERSCERLVRHGEYRYVAVYNKREPGLEKANEALRPGFGTECAYGELLSDPDFGQKAEGVLLGNDPLLMGLSTVSDFPEQIPAILLPLKKDTYATPFGVLLICTGNVRGFDDKERSMLLELSGDIGFAIESFRQRRIVTEWNATLEERIKNEIAKRREQESMLLEQSKLAAMGEMMIAISHHWRQPLAALGLMIQDLYDAYEYGEMDQAYLKKVVDNSNIQITKMSETISSFVNLVGGGVDPGAFNILDSVKEVATLIHAELDASMIELHLDFFCFDESYDVARVVNEKMVCPRDIDIYGVSSEFKHMLVSMIKNAKEAIEGDKQKGKLKQKGRITIRVTAEEGDAVVKISDNGGGIPEAIKERIFEPYFTTKEQSTGIGLFSTKVFAEKELKGSIAAENINGGACFTLHIPLYKEVR